MREVEMLYKGFEKHHVLFIQRPDIASLAYTSRELLLILVLN